MKKKSLKNILLKSITATAALTAVVSAFLIEEYEFIPFLVSCVCVAWLYLFGYANGFFNFAAYEEGEKK